jgi:hypothetical protein
MQDQVQQRVLWAKRQAPPLGENERARPAPEPFVVDAHDALEAEIARDVPMEIEEDSAADELGEAPRFPVTLGLGPGRPVAEPAQNFDRPESMGGTDQQVDVRHRPQSRLGIDRVRERDALEGDGLDPGLTQGTRRLAPARDEHGAARPGALRTGRQSTLRFGRQAVKQIETAQIPVDERDHAFAAGAVDDEGPVQGPAGDLGEATVRGLVGSRARPKQERTADRVGRGRRRRVYEVELVRDPFPIEVRWAVLQVPFVARQHVVVSAPKMLLGSRVGFSYGRFS